MRRYIIIGAVIFALALAWMMILRRNHPAGIKSVVASFTKAASDYAHSLNRLSVVLQQLNDDTATVISAREALLDCRLRYKRIAWFITFYFPDQALIFNGPPVPETELGMNEYRDPTGMQVIEAGLYGANITKNKKLLTDQVKLMQRSLESMLSLTSNFEVASDDLWYAMSLEFIRVYTLYITGFDAPQLKSGIREAAVSVNAIDSAISLMTGDAELHQPLQYANVYLQNHPQFDTFDRLYFIDKYALPLQQLLNEHVVSTPADVSMQSAVNMKAKSLFAPDGLNRDFFPGAPEVPDSLLISLGKRLFSERRLSANNDRSCASCHSPDMFFSDRLKRNKNRELTGDLPRNTPSLMYAAYQFHQFWDGRVRTLTEQAIAVMNDTLEMKGPGDEVAQKIKHDTSYKQQFVKIWNNDSGLTEEHIASALAAYERTLAPFRSPFDRYMAGDRSALSAAQQRGFNLFMGKAMCGTCHFAPLFNGLLPPFYNITEFEILGTPLDDNFMHVQPDRDTGQSRMIASMPQGAFKTPTIRNAAATAPYMHNGGFRTIENVIEFYDKGGGQGLGLRADGQTLSAEQLHLDSLEKKDLRAFIESLTDEMR